jgi:PKD repeat protein
MTKATLLLSGAICLALMTGCRKEPNANIDTDKTRIQVGEQITFYNESTDGDSYEWDFGDGTTSTETEPKKSYDNTGTFTVRLIAYSKKKKKQDDDRTTITVVQKPFEGTHSLEANFSEELCLSGSTTYTSGVKSYQMVIRKGANSNEIIIDNLGGLGINNVKATVTQSVFFFGMETYSFNVTAGQTLVDSQGRTWSYNASGIRGEFDSVDQCRTIYISLFRTVNCGGFSTTLDYTENSSTGC